MGRINARTRFEEKINSGTPPLGAFVMSTDAAVTAVLGVVGYDFAIINREHGPNDVATTLGHIRAADANGVIPLVRVLENNHTQIQSNLDIGAQGIMVPKISTVDDACRALAATRYAPSGRGACSTVEGARWTMDWNTHALEANDQIIVVPLIETAAGIENLEHIVAIKGIDYVFIGFADLAQDMEIDSIADRDQIDRIWADCLRIGHQHGVRVGCNVGSGFPGADFGTVSGDLKMVMSGATEQLSAARTMVRTVDGP